MYHVDLLVLQFYFIIQSVFCPVFTRCNYCSVICAKFSKLFAMHLSVTESQLITGHCTVILLTSRQSDELTESSSQKAQISGSLPWQIRSHEVSDYIIATESKKSCSSIEIQLMQFSRTSVSLIFHQFHDLNRILD